MRIFLCTITFRHHLVSLDEIARFAKENEFQGIELWGIHARNAARPPRCVKARYGEEWLAGHGLSVPMLSDYLPVEGVSVAETAQEAADLCRLARHWGASKIRTFAGGRASAGMDGEERRGIASRLSEICRIAGDHGLRLLVETHPNTLADTLASTLRLIEEVNHPALGINFDTLHVWEGGDDPVEAHAALLPHIAHYHLKNVRAREDLAVFAPANVYAAAGRREGMTPLFGGIVDYEAFLAGLRSRPDAEASLEWFGPDGFDVVARDRRSLAGFFGETDSAAWPEQLRKAAGF